MKDSQTSKVIQMSAMEPTTGDPFGYVYAVGVFDPRFPSEGVYQEYLQACAEKTTRNPPEDKVRYEVLKEKPYLAREVEWVFLIDNVDSYQVIPRTPLELQDMVETIAPDPTPDTENLTLLIGVNEPQSSTSNLPVVNATLVYYFDVKEFVDNVPLPSPPPSNVTSYRTEVQKLFDKMIQTAANPGDSHEHRAINYVTFRYPKIYTLTWSLLNPKDGAPKVFSSLTPKKSLMGGDRDLIDLIFTFRDQTMGASANYYLTVDASGQFPFLVSELKPYIKV